MHKYKSSAELKGMAKEQMFGSYGTAIGASLLLGLIMLCAGVVLELFSAPAIIGNGISALQLVISYLIGFIFSLFGGILTSGEAFFYLKITCRQQVSLSDIFYGFKIYPDKALRIQLILSLISYICQAPMLVFYYLFRWNMHNVSYLLFMSIFAVAGSVVMIILNLMLSQSFYLLQDFPQYTAKELLNMSCRITKGHKGRLFYISISFIPLYLLGSLSCGIAFLWLIPYTNAVMANFYMDLMKNRQTAN